MKRKLLAVFLSVILFAVSLPTAVSALVYEDYVYKYVSGGVAIEGYNGAGTSITIPDTIGGQKVIELSPSAFENSNLVSVVLPQHLEKVGNSAFLNSASLVTVVYNEQLKTIDSHAFEGCINLTSIPSIPALETIGSYGFYGCSSLNAFYGFDTLTTIGAYAFKHCTGLKRVTVPKGVSVISEAAFYGCSNIQTITLYDTLAVIDTNAFYGLQANKEVVFMGDIDSWNAIIFTTGNDNLLNTDDLNIMLACEHEYQLGFYEEPTCKKDGIESIQCVYCKKKVETIIPATNKHVYSFYYETFPDCNTVGTGYEECIYCGEVGETNVIIPKNSHEFSEVVKYVAPTIRKSGKWVYGCEWCDATKTVKIDPLGKKISKAKISVSNKTYTGKAIKPTVTVKYSGKKLKKGTDYTVSYKNNKKIGTATAIIKGKGKYIGTKTVTFKITPKKTSIKKLSSGKKKIKVKWGKVSNSSGYQIVLATNKGYTKNKKVVNVSKKSTVSKTVTKLKAKKTYYVKMRAYKTVKGKKIYSSYTKTVKVKTK